MIYKGLYSVYFIRKRFKFYRTASVVFDLLVAGLLIFLGIRFILSVI
jgi:hypothetical protein